MELTVVVVVLGLLAFVSRAQHQARRIALLASALGKYQIEKHMETLIDGYFRALAEDDTGRRAHVFELLRPTEQALAAQFTRFAEEFARTPDQDARVSKLPFFLAFASRLPGASFDVREALEVHARGIRRAIDVDPQAAPRERAFTVVAELLLMQHTCHWYCRSRLVASARMLKRHNTSYEQALGSVLASTRADYRLVVDGR